MQRVLAAVAVLATALIARSGPPAQASGGSPSGQPMPTSAPAGWQRVFSDDFTTPVALGGFASSGYASRWRWYPTSDHDTSGNGRYNPAIISVADGVLTEHLHTENGTAQVAAILPKLPGTANGRLYGRYTVRFRADATAVGYKVAWLQWPDSEIWNDGEIDFPEGDLDSTISGFSHCANIGHPEFNCLAYSSTKTFRGWHTATQVWTAGRVTFLLDGVQVATSTIHTPSKPMHWVLQTETRLSGGPPPASSHGRVQIDWATVDVPI